MIGKRFLVPVLALAAFGLPASASVIPYCDNGCSSNTAVFNSLVASTPYTYAYITDQTFTGSLIGGNTEYLDGTGVQFVENTSTFSITGSNGLEAQGTHDTITITVPAAYAAIQLSLSSLAGNSNFTCIDASCDGTQLSTTPIFVDYINNTAGSSWTIQISASSPENIVINGFDPASLGTGTGGGGTGGTGGSETPEVATFLLIGSGLIVMRWLHRLPRRFFRTQQPA